MLHDAQGVRSVTDFLRDNEIFQISQVVYSFCRYFLRTNFDSIFKVPYSEGKKPELKSLKIKIHENQNYKMLY